VVVAESRQGAIKRRRRDFISVHAGS